jgi:Cu+-exporting ATPase
VQTVLAAEPGFSEQEVLSLAASVEALSEHPLAQAVVASAGQAGLAPLPVEGFRSHAGKGVSGDVGGRRVAVGSRAYVRETASLPDELPAAAGRMAATPVFVAVDGRVAAALAISDPLRPTSRLAVEQLKRLGLEMVLLTGDDARTAEAVAQAAGIGRVVAGVLPEGKLAEVRRLQGEGRVVAMVGDGVNDAPALAQADVGIAMGGGTDVALEAGDVALLRGDLGGVAAALALARRALRTMKQNLFWAFAYNVVALPVAAGALYPPFGILLSPVLASAAMAFSSLSVVANSLRLKNARLP